MDNEQLIKIIELSKKKVHLAFKELVEYYQDYAFSLAFRLTCNDEEAKDIVQESFIKVWNHLSKFNHNTKFTTWLYKIVYNLSLDKLKANKRRKRVLVEQEKVSESFNILTGEHLETEIVNKDLAAIILSLAEGLTPKQHSVFVLRDIQGFTMDEISEITSMSKGTVKSNLYYARANIREKLEKLKI